MRQLAEPHENNQNQDNQINDPSGLKVSAQANQSLLNQEINTNQISEVRDEQQFNLLISNVKQTIDLISEKLIQRDQKVKQQEAENKQQNQQLKQNQKQIERNCKQIDHFKEAIKKYDAKLQIEITKKEELRQKLQNKKIKLSLFKNLGEQHANTKIQLERALNQLERAQFIIKKMENLLVLKGNKEGKKEQYRQQLQSQLDILISETQQIQNEILQQESASARLNKFLQKQNQEYEETIKNLKKKVKILLKDNEQKIGKNEGSQEEILNERFLEFLAEEKTQDDTSNEQESVMFQSDTLGSLENNPQVDKFDVIFQSPESEALVYRRQSVESQQKQDIQLEVNESKQTFQTQKEPVKEKAKLQTKQKAPSSIQQNKETGLEETYSKYYNFLLQLNLENAKPKTEMQIFVLFEEFMDQKLLQDKEDIYAGIQPKKMPLFFYEFMKQKYGIKPAISQNIASVLKSLQILNSQKQPYAILFSRLLHFIDPIDHNLAVFITYIR